VLALLRLLVDADAIGRGGPLLAAGAKQCDENARETHNFFLVRLIGALWAGLSVSGANTIRILFKKLASGRRLEEAFNRRS
jgi:hypothetical protein